MLEFENNFTYLYIIMAAVAFIVIVLKPSLKINNFLVVIFGIFWILLFGFRDLDVGSDTRAYIYSFNNFISSNGSITSEDFKDFGYYIFMVLVSQITNSERLFLVLFDFIYIFPLIYLFLKIKTNHVFILFFSFCSFFFFKSMGINVMRQGVGVSFFLLGLLFFFENQKKKAYLLFLIGYLFHGSLIISILTIFVTEKIKNLKVPVIIFILGIGLAFIGFDFSMLFAKVPFLNFVFEERLQGYIEYDDAGYETGFRLNFIIFNSIFALIGIYFHKKGVNETIPYYNKILYSYLILSAVFFLMFTLPFSDRTGILSWILIPLILLPLIQVKHADFSILKLYFLSIFIFVFFYS